MRAPTFRVSFTLISSSSRALIPSFFLWEQRQNSLDLGCLSLSIFCKSNPTLEYPQPIELFILSFPCSASFFPLLGFMAAVEMSRHEIQIAIAKAVELRALHAALMKGNSPANGRFPFPSPASQFSAQDYPVFTPSYEAEAVPGTGYQQNPTVSESGDEKELLGGNGMETIVQYYKQKSTSTNIESHICAADDYFKSSRRNSLDDFNSLSSCNRCKAAEFENTSNPQSSNIIVPLTDSHSSPQSQPKSKGVISWLFPRLKKKHKHETSPSTTESEQVSQLLKDMEMMSIETLKKELIEANENRDAALMQVSEMQSSLGDLKQKLEYLESYCEELKKALRQAKDSQLDEKLNNVPRNGENLMPVSEQVMVEGFLQIVSESRLSVKQFCKTLISKIEENDQSLTDNLNRLLQPFKLSLNSRYSKAVLYHFEALINQCLYQDFENSVFQKNGCPKLLDPQRDRQANFSSFVALRNMSWNEVLRKGTKYYSEEFSKFCDQKMSCIMTSLNWRREWPEELLQAFFVAAKCIWLLHLLAFSFKPALGILRVEENTSFDGHYMEDMCGDRQRSHGGRRVKMMVMPGFYVQDRVLRCKVLCRYKSAA